MSSDILLYMTETDFAFSSACSEILDRLLATHNPTKKQTRAEIKKICAKYSLDRIPRNHEILSMAGKSDYAKLRNILIKKPVKTASGVAVVALMPKPYACPHGRCTYCPGGVEFNSPNSYTGNEPSTKSAIESNYDPTMQIKSKIEKLRAFGHDTTKIELVIVGGTFLFMPKDYQENFIKSCYDALNGTISENLQDAIHLNEHADMRNVGFTVETKPDFCKRVHVDQMLHYGITRIEIGVQALQDKVYQMVNRGHNYSDVVESFQISRDAGYKLVAHMMPGLPSMTPKDDIADFEKLFNDPDLKPDMLKIYPSLVVKNTPLAKDYFSGKYKPYSDDDMINVLTEVKKIVPRWVRIMRVQREISSDEILAGPRQGNLRQLVHQNLKRQGFSCMCIRCREIGLSNISDMEMPEICRIDYDSSGGNEVFLSFEDSKGLVYGFLRLRKPSSMAHRSEIDSRTCIVREVHVLGRSLKIGQRDKEQIQHAGLGRALMEQAEKISREELDCNKLLVISAVGTREYYQKLGYSLYGPYMSKVLK